MVPSSTPSPAISSKTVLFIEDDEKDQEYWLNEIRRLSPEHTFLKANDGESGLSICRKLKVDCIVLDLDLPGMSGFETLLNLKADPLFRFIPIVVLTRLQNPLILRLAKEHGAHECLIKGYTSFPGLDETIKRALHSAL
jgi:CheY-like chemotaxis protein